MIRQVTVEDLADAVDNGQVVVVDVRDPAEYAQGHPPSAINIPLDSIVERCTELDWDTPVYLVSGGHSRAWKPLGRSTRAFTRHARPTVAPAAGSPAGVPWKAQPMTNPRPQVIVFDVNETLSDLAPIGRRFQEVGAPEHLGQLWFTSVLRDGFALTAAGIVDSFEALLSVEDAGVWKPARAAYSYALERCGVAPRDAMLVAVHPWDIDGARRAGLATAWINRDGRSYPAHLFPADLVASSILSLAEQLGHSHPGALNQPKGK